MQRPTTYDALDGLLASAAQDEGIIERRIVVKKSGFGDESGGEGEEKNGKNEVNMR